MPEARPVEGDDVVAIGKPWQDRDLTVAQIDAGDVQQNDRQPVRRAGLDEMNATVADRHAPAKRRRAPLNGPVEPEDAFGQAHLDDL